MDEQAVRILLEYLLVLGEFSTKILQILGFCPKPTGWHCPVGNPRSATVLYCEKLGNFVIENMINILPSVNPSQKPNTNSVESNVVPPLLMLPGYFGFVEALRMPRHQMIHTGSYSNSRKNNFKIF